MAHSQLVNVCLEVVFFDGQLSERLSFECGKANDSTWLRYVIDKCLKGYVALFYLNISKIETRTLRQLHVITSSFASFFGFVCDWVD